MGDAFSDQAGCPPVMSALVVHEGAYAPQRSCGAGTQNTGDHHGNTNPQNRYAVPGRPNTAH